MIWSSFLWFLEHWWLILWAAGVVVAYIYGGRNLAFVVLTLGVGAFAYNRGKSDVNKHAKEVEEKRENAYKNIENRGTGWDDVIERLRNRKF